MRNKFNKSLHYQRVTSHPRAGGNFRAGRKWSAHWETSREQRTFLLLVLQHHLTAKLLSTHHLIIASSHLITFPIFISPYLLSFYQLIPSNCPISSHLIPSHFPPLRLLISSHLPSLQSISSPLILTICYHPISSAYLACTQTSFTLCI